MKFQSSRISSSFALGLCCAAILCPTVRGLDTNEPYDAADRSYLLAGDPFSFTGSAYYGRTTAGDFDGDLTRDVVQMIHSGSSHVAAVYFAPSNFQAPLALSSSTIDDIETFRTATGHSVLYLDSAGLSKATYTYSATSTPAHSMQSTLLSGSNTWKDALLVRDADPASSTTTSVVAIGGSSGWDLLLGATAANNWVPTSSVSIGAPVREIAMLQWDGSGAYEIAVATASGPRIYSSTGTLLEGFSSYPLESRIAVVRQSYPSPAPADRLAVVLTVTAPDYQVLGIVKAASNGTAVLENSVSLGQLGATALVGADQDNDGDDDLFFSNRQTCLALVMHNARTNATTTTQTATSFTDTNFDTIPLLALNSATTAAADNTATPMLTDLDGDNDVDFFMGVPWTGAGYVRKIRVVLNETEDHELLRPLMTHVYGTVETATYEVRFLRSQVPSGATHIQLDAWYGAGSYVSGVPFDLNNSEISSAPQPILISSVASNTDFSFTVPYPNYGSTNTIGSIGLRARFVTMSGSTLTTVYPALVGMLTNRDTELAAIAALEFSGEELIGEVPGGTDLPETVGGFVPRPKIGPYAGTVPKVN